MNELRDAKGYGDLGLSSQNLRDQAARLKKTLEESSENLSWEAKTDASSRSKKCLWMQTSIGGNSTGFTSLPIYIDLFFKKQGVNHNIC